MLFALHDFVAYCLYSISRFFWRKRVAFCAPAEKPAVFVMQRIR